MKRAISNIAWDTNFDAQVLPLLQEYGYRGVEIAPKKYFPDIPNFSQEEVKKVLRLFGSFGLEIPAFQSILFGENHLKVFESEDNRKESSAYLKRVIDLANALRVKVVVFGSPKNRIIPEGYIFDAQEIAGEFFCGIGAYAYAQGVKFCIEANPVEYGGNFINTTKEGADFVRYVNSPGFQLHVDAGTMIMNQENFEEILSQNIDIIAHYHISNPNLTPLNHPHEEHKKLGNIVKDIGFTGWCSIEMLIKDIVSPVNIIQESLGEVKHLYPS